MLRLAIACLLFGACSCGGSSETGEGSRGPTRLEPGLADEAESTESSGAGPVRIEEEAVDPPPVEPPP